MPPLLCSEFLLCAAVSTSTTAPSQSRPCARPEPRTSHSQRMLNLFLPEPPPPEPLLCRRALLRTVRRGAPQSRALHHSPVHSCYAPESSAIVHTRGAHRYKPKVQFSNPERDGAGPSKTAATHSLDQVTETPPALAPASILEEAQASEPPSRLYQTQVGPRPTSLEHPRPRRRAPPSKRARTSGLGESSRSRPEPSPHPANQSSSPQLSLASRIRRPVFSCDPIPGNINHCGRDFHMESYYDIPTLTADQRFRDSMRLIQRYSLLPFMTPRQFFYPWVVLEFYHTITSRGVPSQMENRFSIDSRPGVLRGADITAALGLPVVLANSTDYRRWPQPS